MMFIFCHTFLVLAVGGLITIQYQILIEIQKDISIHKSLSY